MNRKAEGIMNLIAIQMAKLRGDLDGLGGLGKSLEELTLDWADFLSIDEWGAARELAERAQEHRIECLRALGFLPKFVPSSIPSKAMAGIGPLKEEEKPPVVRRAARPPGTRKGVVSKKAGKAPADAATGRQAKESGGES
jgi:hypothetical protein